MSTVGFQVSAERRPRTMLATLADPARAIIGPKADFVWIYGSPFLAIAVVHVLLALPFINNDITIGEPTSIVAFTLAAITFAHLVPVFVRSHLNPTIRRAFPWRMLAVPPLLVATLSLWPAALIVGGVLAAFWDVYHTAQQNFGLGRIYDSRAGVANERSRRADRLISHVLYLGPILAGRSLISTLGDMESLDQVGWKVLARTPKTVGARADLLRTTVILVMVVSVVAYVRFMVRLAREGVRSSPHKVVLMVSSAVVQVLAWGFSSPLVAFMIVNLYHAVQYFALVWHIEGRKASRQIGIRSPRAALPFGLLAVFIVPAVVGAAMNGVYSNSAFVNASFLSVSLLHFWMDGFIWSVRTNSV